MSDKTVMTERNIIDDITRDTGLPKQDVQKVVRMYCEQVLSGMWNGVDTVVVGTLGRFHKVVNAPRTFINPQDPDRPVDVPERWTFKFKPSVHVKDASLKKNEDGEFHRDEPEHPFVETSRRRRDEAQQALRARKLRARQVKTFTGAARDLGVDTTSEEFQAIVKSMSKPTSDSQ